MKAVRKESDDWKKKFVKEISFKCGVKGWGSDRWWKQRWWMWWGDMHWGSAWKPQITADYRRSPQISL